MISEEHKKEADCIGSDSYHLIHLGELPPNAPTEQVLEALRADLSWQESHHCEVTRRLERLISDILEEEWSKTHVD